MGNVYIPTHASVVMFDHLPLKRYGADHYMRCGADRLLGMEHTVLSVKDRRKCMVMVAEFAHALFEANMVKKSALTE